MKLTIKRYPEPSITATDLATITQSSIQLFINHEHATLLGVLRTRDDAYFIEPVGLEPDDHSVYKEATTAAEAAEWLNDAGYHHLSPGHALTLSL